jgi:YD repeat-containing protein
MRNRQGICLLAVVLLSFANACFAQTATPEDEYKKLVQVDTTIQPLGEHPFGEQVDLYKGTLSFEETDVSLPGNGPALQLSRSLSTTEALNYTLNLGLSFGDWDLDIPRIETASANEITVKGWVVQGPDPQNRCSAFDEPPYIPATQPGGDTWGPDEWWYGYHLIVPGEGDQRLLKGGGAASPMINGKVSSIATKQNWALGCGVTADDGGEGFLAIAPDGTRYTFAHLMYRPMAFMQTPLGTAPDSQAVAAVNGGIHPNVAPFNILARRDAFMFVTQVQDRFGNTLTYDYDSSTGYLSDIKASDGRKITLTYVSGTPLIHTATTQAADGTSRTWTYAYSTSTRGLPTLTSVTLPDGSAWSYNLASFLENPTYLTGANCSANLLGSVDQNPATGTVTTPSGLTGTFVLAPVLHGRSYVPKVCLGGVGPQATSYGIPNATYLQSIASETITGAGLPVLPAETWSYDYSPSNQSWKTDSCASDKTCATTVYVDVTDPNHNATRYTFSNEFDATEGQLKKTEYYSGAAGGTLLRSEINTYADPTTGAWPASYGFDLGDRDNVREAYELSPLSLKQTIQDGDTYTWQAEAFNVYAQVTKAKRSNSIPGQSALEEATSYLNDTGAWVLGLPEQVTNVASGEVESLNTYDANDNLQSRARFGQTLMSYTFNSAGQLASFTDGNGNQTTLGSYKRGIPQAIHYPATTDFPTGTNETLVVDDFGQITSLTDQLGHTTSYSYDPAGRVIRINYPAGDEVAWASQTFTYNFVTSAERGVSANHWKRTATLGGANTITYFDAMLRPVLSDSNLGSTVQTSTLTTYDSKGQKIFSAYPSATALTFSQSPTVAGSTTTYDALGRTTQVQQSSELGTLTSSTAYLSGARQQTTDPKGNITTTSYQVFDEPRDENVIRVDAPTGITQTIARDVYGNPQSITQSGPGTDPVIKKFFYDSHYRLCRTSEPESGSEVMAYDAANNLTWSAAGLAFADTDSCEQVQAQVLTAAKTTRTYDAMNRLKTIQPPAGTQSTAYTYDALGNIATTVSGIAIQGYSRNARGMLTNETLWIPGAGLVWGINYIHDVNGHLSSVHYPDGENVSYAPDALGRPTQAGSYAQGVNYFANGQVKDFAFGNGATYVSDQCGSDLKNCRQLLSNFGYGHGGIAQLSEDLTYDKNGNITGVADVAGGPRDKSFGYDALNRLTSATADHLWGTQAYTYDALNNLRTLQSGSQTSTYAYDTTNRLTSISNGGSPLVTYRYDTRGNVIGENTTNLEFDQKNQLTRIGATGPSYEYDAAGRRIKKTNADGDTYYFYSQAGQLMYQAVPATMKSTNFIYLGSKLVARDEASAPTLSAPAISGTGNYTVSWTDLRATSYNLQEQVNGGSWTTIQSGSATASAITGKSNGVYRYEVQACNASLCGQWSNVASTTVIFPPPAPASITIPATSSGSVAVSWAASITATSYTLQHANYGITGWSTIYTGSATGYTSHETVSGAWIYQVQACNAGGCSTYKVTSGGALVTIAPASAPSLTVPTTSYTGSYTVSWGGVTGATSYTLQEQVNGGSWATIQATSATSKALSGKGSGTYGYLVKGCNVSGCGPSGTKTVVVTRIPAVPASISAPSSEPYPAGSWTVSWAAVGGATSYTLQRTNTATSAVVAAYSGSATSTIDGHSLLLVPGSYVYAVKACNVAGCSGWRNSAALVMFCPRSPGVAKPDSVQPDQISCGGTP